ncbi:DUF6325 family protein [Nocardioides ungokensis]|uniref:DUF6325 family protein n=1 Tax=Nocardioides ungokensis TaxID=1643322 RepID=UPI0015DE7C26|nr:DUF6325 family protein [Nocardioides ungokensis]
MATERPERPDAEHHEIDFDLVEYLVIAVPDLASVGDIAEAIRRLVRTDRMRILDLVAVVISADGAHVAVEPEAVAGMAVLRDVKGEVGGLLSEDDIAMACGDLPAGTAAVILVAEDRWADILAGAARKSGGRIVGGERIPRYRIEATFNATRRHGRPGRSAGEST